MSKGTSKLISELEATAEQLQPKLVQYAQKMFGHDVAAEAWEEFSLFSGAKPDAEEFSTVFPSWFLYNWSPGFDEEEEEHAHNGCCGHSHSCGDEEEEEVKEQGHDSCCSHSHSCCDEEEEGDVAGLDIDDALDFEEDEEDDEDFDLDEEEGEDFDFEDEDFAAAPIAVYAYEDEDVALTDAEKEFIEAAVQAPFSLFLVEKAAGGELVLRDLLLDNKRTVSVLGSLPSEAQGNIILGRVMTIKGVDVLYGVAPFALKGSREEEVSDIADGMRMLAGKIDSDTVSDWDMAIREHFYELLKSEEGAGPRSQIVPEEVDLDDFVEEDESVTPLMEALTALQVKQMVDEPIEEFGGCSLRQLASSEKGRGFVDAMLKEKAADSTGTAVRVHIKAVRAELGLEDAN